MLCDDLKVNRSGTGWEREVQEGGDMCAHIVDSLRHCTTETSNIPKQLYLNKNENNRNAGFPSATSGKEPACHCRRHKR